MSIPARLAPRLRHVLSSVATIPSRGFMSTAKVAKEEWPQRHPLGPFYESLLKSPPLILDVKPEDPPNSADPEVLPPGKKPVPTETTPEKKPKRKPGRPRKTDTTKTDTSASSTPAPATPTAPEPTPQARARIIFGSRLLGPAEEADKLQVKQAKSKYIAGVLVPPRPEEPDNCCMSGCVDCVWERYREEMEEWSTANHAAQRALKTREATMNADGGGSEASWGPRVGETKIAKDLWDEDIFEDIPVGIKEFMKQEKRLKERHQREGTVRG
ncbi:Fc.00g044380.m01.CDS01 [Cosmosporella sp. VM-42]